jgi:DNA-3-methyladenine glycosylase
MTVWIKNAPGPILSPEFFSRGTVTVARELLGQWLLVQEPATGLNLACRIVETEAYTQDDPACHAYQRCTGRAATLYKAPGLSYVYLIYGMYHCLNVVTEPAGTAGAVLFRAVEPPEEFQELKTHGPGRLCRALSITCQQHNELPMTASDSPLRLHAGAPLPDGEIVQTTRIGISAGQDRPWRFYWDQSRHVSVRQKPSPSPHTKK